jgi:hypothetical protein
MVDRGSWLGGCFLFAVGPSGGGEMVEALDGAVGESRKDGCEVVPNGQLDSAAVQ